MNSDGKKIIKFGLLALFFIFIIGYAFFRSKDLIFGVKIKEISLPSGPVRESVQEIRGNAENAVYLSLNGREISIDQEGNFHEAIALLPGYNIVSIAARDKFGNTDEEIYKLIYSPTESAEESNI